MWNLEDSHACKPAFQVPLLLDNLGWRHGDENINSVLLEELSRLGEVGGCTEILGEESEFDITLSYLG